MSLYGPSAKSLRAEPSVDITHSTHEASAGRVSSSRGGSLIDPAPREITTAIVTPRARTRSHRALASIGDSCGYTHSSRGAGWRARPRPRPVLRFHIDRALRVPCTGGITEQNSLFRCAGKWHVNLMIGLLICEPPDGFSLLIGRIPCKSRVIREFSRRDCHSFRGFPRRDERARPQWWPVFFKTKPNFPAKVLPGQSEA